MVEFLKDIMVVVISFGSLGAFASAVTNALKLIPKMEGKSHYVLGCLGVILFLVVSVFDLIPGWVLDIPALDVAIGQFSEIIQKIVELISLFGGAKLFHKWFGGWLPIIGQSYSRKFVMGK